MKSNCLILGSSGFVGSSIAKNINFKKKFKLLKYNSKNLNILSKNKISNLFKKKLISSVVIYAAGKHRLYGDTIKIKKNNIKIFKNFLSLIDKYKPKKIIFLSTVEIYGSNKRKKKITEESKINPLNNYAGGKLIQENILKKICKKNRVDFSILRMPGVYGKCDKGISIVSKIFNSFNGKKFILNGSGNEKRDYLYIGNLINLLFKLSTMLKTPKTINVVSGKSFSINQIIKIIEKKLNKKRNITFNNCSSDFKYFDLKFNTKKLKKNKLDNIIKPLNKNISNYIKLND